MDVEGLEEGVLETVPWDKVVNINYKTSAGKHCHFNTGCPKKSDFQNAAEAQKPKLSAAGPNVPMDMTWERFGPALSW